MILVKVGELGGRGLEFCTPADRTFWFQAKARAQMIGLSTPISTLLGKVPISSTPMFTVPILPFYGCKCAGGTLRFGGWMH